MKRTALQPFRRHLRTFIEVCLLVTVLARIAPGQEEVTTLVEQEIVIEDPDFIEIEAPEDQAVQPGKPASRRAQVDGQVLHLSDRNTLHGTLSSIDTQRREITWSRTDFSAPLILPMEAVTSVTVAENQEPASASSKATVKFSGGDWVTADVIGLKNGKLQLHLADNSSLMVDRDRVEWIYFSKTTAPECYDGPTSIAGWVTDGNWTFREGALRALRPGPIGRSFESLPDRVEYFLEVDQRGDFQAFTVNLRGIQAAVSGVAQGRMQVMFTASDLRLWAQIGDEMKVEQVDLRKALGLQGNADEYRPPKNEPVRLRLLEDFPGGRLIVFINGRKAAEWSVAKGESGKHRGGFSFQPMVWNADSQQSISRVRVVPWDGVVPPDGAPVDDRGDEDSVLSVSGERKSGELNELTAASLKLGAGGEFTEIPREQVTLVRFRRTENPPEEDAAVAHLRLARRGEFDVSNVSLHGGQVAARTTFGSEMLLPLAAIRSVELFGAPAASDQASDVLVFKNGDRLRGTLEGIANNQPIHWRPSGGKTAVDIQPGRVMGVLLAAKPEPPASKSGVIARFRNDDVLSGEFTGLSDDQLLINNAQMGALTIARDHLRTLYFPLDGVSPVLDGTTGTELWMSCAEFRKPTGSTRDATPKTAPSSPWRYFDGAFTFQRPEGNAANRGGTYLGRVFEAMPQSVEISFQVSAVKSPSVFSVQLFSEPSNPGYMMQFYAEGLFLHDMSPRGRNRGAFQQQFPFDDKVRKDALQHHIRILTDRPSGRVAFVVDGVVIGQVVRKPGEGARNLGRGFMLLPQTNTSCTFSDLWIGPWNGQIPGREPNGASELQHSVLLANGDESRGTVQTASPETVKFESEVGQVELPTSRLTMLDFGPSAVKVERGARLRLVNHGTLTVSTYRIENGFMICQSAVAGELKLPLSAIQEIALIAPQAKGNGVKKDR